MENNDNIEIETGIDDTLDNDKVIDAVSPTDAVDDAETSQNDGDISNDDREVNEECAPLFDREEWGDMVGEFESEYPDAREYFEEIGDYILENENLWNDAKCLEKAYIGVLGKHGSPIHDGELSEDFLANYIYNNEKIKSKIVDEYIESLADSRLPSTINRGGRISLSPVSRPRTIKEAGILAERIMKR